MYSKICKLLPTVDRYTVHSVHRLVFLLGQTEDEEIQSKVEEEAAMFQDVVQVRILD
jgi:Galactosyltransferase